MSRTLSVLTATAALLGTLATSTPAQWSNLGFGTNGTAGVPRLFASKARFGRAMHLHLRSARPHATLWFGIGLNRIDQPLFGGTLIPNPQLIFQARSDGVGYAHLAVPVPNLCNLTLQLYVQALVMDPQGPSGFAFSNAGKNLLVDHVPSDFNGDGLTDLAIGVPGEDSGVRADVGEVQIVYGRKTGLSPLGQTIRQGLSTTGGVVAGAAEAGDQFGAAIAVGDFNGDGYDDMAVGVPRESIESANATEAGAVHAIYGGIQGLHAANDQLFVQGQNGLGDTAEPFDWFGKSLAVADFNADGFDDLAIGAPYENSIAVNDGIVQVIFGSAGGLQASVNRQFSGLNPRANDRHGWSLAAGDFEGDGFADLAVGQPYRDVSGQQDAGAVVMVYVTRSGYRTLSFNQDSKLGSVNIQGVAEKNDLFGFSLTAGDFDGDGVDDLAVGAPFEDIGNVVSAGAVNVVYGVRGPGLQGAGNQVWHQDSPGIFGIAGLADYFGYALTTGDFDDNGVDDLAIGVPGDRVGTTRAGTAAVLYGVRSSGLGSGDQLWSQNSNGMVNTAGKDDHFGWSMFAGDVNGDCRFDLVIGVPGETIGVNARAGAAHVIYGTATGLRSLNNEIWFQRNSAADDRLGASVAGSQDQRPL